MAYAESLVELIDWSSYGVCGSGAGDAVGPALRALINSEDKDAAWRAWWEFEGKAFARNTVYGAAEPAVTVLVASLADERSG